jgi:glycosyltransferase involved in cell wall biosynthesis
MRLSLARMPKGNRGIDRFLSLLITKLKEQGVEIVDTDKRSDIHLAVISGSKKKGSRNVVRIDGVYYDTARLGNNKTIKNTIQSFEGVVYQSAWSKKFATGMLRVSNPKSAVIWNGTDPSIYRKADPYKHDFDKAFVCCAHWRPNKRLAATIEAFRRTRKQLDRNLGLFIVGEPDCKVPNDPAIKAFGSVKKRSELASIYRASNYLVHICHLDACPNSVVEALVCGLPVLSNNIGGTPELVGSDGIILPLDQPFNFKPVSSIDRVVPIDLDILADGMKSMVARDWVVDRPDLDISRSAQQYMRFFGELL